MEIFPFLRLNGARVAALCVVAVCAALGGAALARQQPVIYTGQATVFLERVYTGPRFEREPQIANFKTAVKALPEVQAKVSEQTGVSVKDLLSHATVEVAPSSDIATITFTSSNAEVAQATAQALAQTTLQELTSASVVAAQANAQRAQQTHAAAAQQLTELTAPFGVLDLEREYEAVTGQVKDLERQVASTPSDNSSLATTQSLLEFRLNQRSLLAEALPAYREQADRVDKLRSESQGAQARLDEANTRLAVADNNEAVVAGLPSPESATQKMVRFGGAAALAAVTLALLAIVVFEAMRRRGGVDLRDRPAARHRPDARDPSAGAWPATAFVPPPARATTTTIRNPLTEPVAAGSGGSGPDSAGHHPA